MQITSESVENLVHNLAAHNVSLDKLPYVIQYNKRDLPEIASVEDLRAELNTLGVPDFEAAAKQGKGVFETLKGLSRLVLTKLAKEG